MFKILSISQSKQGVVIISRKIKSVNITQHKIKIKRKKTTIIINIRVHEKLVNTHTLHIHTSHLYKIHILLTRL